MNENTTTPRDKIESGILGQAQNEIDEVLLLDAPTTWADERLDQIEKLVLDGTRVSLAESTDDELRSDGALRTYITQAVAETRSLIHDFQKSLNKWAYHDDPALTTLPIILTLDNEDWATIDATIQRFQPDLNRSVLVGWSTNVASNTVIRPCKQIIFSSRDLLPLWYGLVITVALVAG